MKNKRKILGNGFFLVLIFGLTMYGVFHGEDPGKIAAAIQEVDWIWLLPAVLCVIGFVLGESLVIHYLLRTLQIHLSTGKCFLISCVGFFFSCITPSASGGQPMQMVYLKKEKIPLSVSTLVLMVVTVTYKLVLVLIGVFLLLFQQTFIEQYMKEFLPIFYLGLLLNIICVGFLFLLIFHPMLLKILMMKGYNILVRLHLLHGKTSRMERMERSLDQYHDTAAYIKEHPWIVMRVFLLTFLQRTALFLVTWFVYRGFHLKGTGIYTITMLQAVIAVTVDMLPLPGGMGISEKLFSILFLAVFGDYFLLPGMILSRGISYYTQLLFCAGMTVIAHLLLGKNKGETQCS